MIHELLLYIVIFSYTALVLGLAGSIYIHRKSMDRMEAMMMSMAMGMLIGVSVGTLLGLIYHHQLLVPTLVSMVTGAAVGAAIGCLFSWLAFLDGLLAGWMGGMMGTMLSMMVPIAQASLLLEVMVLWVSGVFILLYVFTKKGPSHKGILSQPTTLVYLLMAFVLVLSTGHLQITDDHSDPKTSEPHQQHGHP